MRDYRFVPFRPEIPLAMNQIPSSIDFAALFEMLEGDKQIVASLLSKFAEELTSDLAASALKAERQAPEQDRL